MVVVIGEVVCAVVVIDVSIMVDADEEEVDELAADADDSFEGST